LKTLKIVFWRSFFPNVLAKILESLCVCRFCKLCFLMNFFRFREYDFFRMAFFFINLFYHFWEKIFSRIFSSSRSSPFLVAFNFLFEKIFNFACCIKKSNWFDRKKITFTTSKYRFGIVVILRRFTFSYLINMFFMTQHKK